MHCVDNLTSSFVSLTSFLYQVFVGFYEAKLEREKVEGTLWRYIILAGL